MSFLQRIGQSETPEGQQLNQQFANAAKPFQCLDTEHKQMKYFVQAEYLVQPVEEPLPGVSYTQQRDSQTGTVKQVAVQDTFQRIPLRSLLKLILESPGTMEKIMEWKRKLMYKADDAKTYGIDAVLKAVVDYINDLETNGVEVDTTHFKDTLKEAWFSPGRSHRSATGFLEERLRNVRKRTHRENCTSREKEDSQAISSTLVIPEPSISPDRAVQLAEWLKNNMWPANQVADYMKETAIHRTQWIRANGTKSIEEITCEFPRLLDTPGMISQDFSVLFPDHAERLFQTWKMSFKDKILCFASQEKNAQELLHNLDNLSPDSETAGTVKTGTLSHTGAYLCM
ncbi:hypothetical protein DPX16_22898 [Anabarilius grahami]|uniref:Uncharacterized protein n=1 Tax=Anabarilius grahami TaxID=495550 RepID=A0A3N0XM50_ANAGA|nr:hypothetical protein DPX16_22898 [Anabarilius grahami]